MCKHKVIGVLFLLFHGHVSAEIIFSTPPRNSEADSQAIYQPLVQAMSKAIGEKVIYEHPRNFIDYSLKMQNGHYDILFDGAHFAQWRATNLHHEILVNLPENLQFMLVTNASRANLNTLHDLLSAKTCAQWTPQLGTLMFLQNYTMTASQPNLHLAKTEDEVFKEFKAQNCDAAILRDKIIYKMPAAERATYKIIYKTPMAPNATMTASTKLSPEKRKALVALLTNADAMKVAKPILESFSRNAVAFNVANPDQFKGLDRLLELSFGWDMRQINNTAAGRQ